VMGGGEGGWGYQYGPSSSFHGAPLQQGFSPSTVVDMKRCVVVIS
jgi:hypothetical protein